MPTHAYLWIYRMCVSGGRLSQPAFILFKVFLSVAASVCVEQIKIKGRPGGANSKDCALKCFHSVSSSFCANVRLYEVFWSKCIFTDVKGQTLLAVKVKLKFPTHSLMFIYSQASPLPLLLLVLPQYMRRITIFFSISNFSALRNACDLFFLFYSFCLTHPAFSLSLYPSFPL